MTVFAVNINVSSLSKHFIQSFNPDKRIMQGRSRMILRGEPEITIYANGLIKSFSFNGNVTGNALIKKLLLEVQHTTGICADIDLIFNLRIFHDGMWGSGHMRPIISDGSICKEWV